jgi:tRNA threonylcarbamoyladenosine biosynthesis protein TsaE
MVREFITRSVEETVELGRRIGEQLKGGEIISLTGNLGAGKTHLVKGIAAGAGAGTSEKVNSPTFVLVNEYKGRLDVYHIDAYRFSKEAEFETIGFDDFCYPGSVVIIEWADKVQKSLAGVELIYIRLSHVCENERKIVFENLPKYFKV